MRWRCNLAASRLLPDTTPCKRTDWLSPPGTSSDGQSIGATRRGDFLVQPIERGEDRRDFRAIACRKNRLFQIGGRIADRRKPVEAAGARQPVRDGAQAVQCAAIGGVLLQRQVKA